MRVRRSDASVQRTRSFAGSFGVPGVSYDGVNTGLSADGRTLVLAQGIRSYPSPSTALRVFDAQNLRPLGRIDLPGMVSVDAISPDGRWLYLVDYKDGSATTYDVRAYDLQKRRLLAKPVVDPREPDEKLQGIPVTRVSSAEGRWAYTLYTGSKPFIHALDTVGRTAVCIDLPSLADADFTEMHLALTGGGLRVDSRTKPVALVDLKTFKVGPPPAAAKATATPSPPARASAADGPPWTLWIVPLVAFGALALLAGRRRRRARLPS
jgi:hypothetical protein